MNNTPSPSHYDILNISPSATKAEVRKSYLKQSLKYHPDKNPTNPEEAKEQFILIGQAYDVLSDETKRLQYDRELATGRRRANRMNKNSNSNNYSNSNTSSAGASSDGPGSYGYSNSTSNTSTSGTSASYEYEQGQAYAQTQSQEEAYESYRQAFDDHMAGLSEDELNKLKTVASVVGSLVGTFCGSKMGNKMGGKSKFVQSIGSSAGSMMGSIVGSQVGTTLVDTVHTQSVDRIMYEEKKRSAMERGEPIPERPKSRGWSDIMSNNEDRNENGSSDWVETGINILGVMSKLAANRANNHR
jgi:curved DNA-binding protein CbpA